MQKKFSGEFYLSNLCKYETKRKTVIFLKMLKSDRIQPSPPAFKNFLTRHG